MSEQQKDTVHTTTWKDKLIKARDGAIKVLYHPTVLKVSRFASDVLEATYAVDTKSPLSVGTAALSLIDSAVTAFELPQPNKLDHFAESYDLVQYNGSLPKVIFESKINESFPTKIVLKIDENMVVKEMQIDDSNKFYYVENIDKSTAFPEPTDRVYYLFYTTKGFNFERLFDIIWNSYSGGIFLAKTSTTNMPSGVVKLNALSSDEYLYIGDISIDDFASDVKKCREDKLSRSFMLVGPPGCGKSSFSINVAQKISNRILKIDPSAARMFGSAELDFLIKNLRPDVIIFDDFDRAALAHDSEHLLFLLENIKNQNPQLVIFATVNEFYRLDKALVRPGRFDEIIWFDEPSLEARKSVVEAYLKKYGINYDEDVVKEIIEKTEGMSPVYVKELCLRIRRKGVGCIGAVTTEFKRSMSGANPEEDFLDGMDEIDPFDESLDDSDSDILDLDGAELALGISAQFAVEDEDEDRLHRPKKRHRKKASEVKSIWTVR